MSDTSQQAVSQEPTLEDVYKSAEEELKPEPKEPKAETPKMEPVPSIPEPYDAEAFKNYLANRDKGITTLQHSVNQLVGYLSQQQIKEARQALSSDIEAAVKTVNEIVGHPRPKVIEAMLDAKAREDVRFKALWDNRQKNPAAWSNALKAVSKEFSEELSVKVDPNLARSQQARKIAQQQMATTDLPKTEQEEWESMTPEAQQARMDRIRAGEE